MKAKLRTRLFVSSIVTIAIVITLIVFVIYERMQINNLTTRLLYYENTSRYARELSFYTQSNAYDVASYLLGQHDHRQIFINNAKIFNDTILNIEKNVNIIEFDIKFINILDKIKALRLNYDLSAQDLFNAADDSMNAPSSFNIERRNRTLRVAEEVNSQLDELTHSLVILSDIEAQKVREILYTYNKRVIIIASIAGLIITFFIFSIQVIGFRVLGTPLQILLTAVNNFSIGNLSSRAVIQNQDEIGDLAKAFNTMAEQLEHQTNQLKLQSVIAEKARKQAEEANTLKTQFLANMSHELRTPLNAIINFTYFIGEIASLTEEQQDLQIRVRANADHLLGLINDILDLAKIEAGHMTLFYEETVIPPILESVLATTTGLIKDKPIDLQINIDDDLPSVRIDKKRIRQVILNLLSNAAKFTDQGTISIHAHTENRFLRIAVTDTGPGIAPEDHHRIFTEFHQGDNQLARKHGGTGLGLAISRKLVLMHGGEMGLESQVGHGSTFYFTLPLSQIQGAATVRAAVQDDSNPVHAPFIVAIDDDPNAHYILRHYLESEGYRYHAVTHSPYAVDTIRSLQPDLVLLDVQMPQIDGWDILIRVRSFPETSLIPVVMCTVVDDQQLGVVLGANDYLVKPIDGPRLLAIAKQWTQHRGTVLIIDDESDSRLITRKYLESMTYRVLEAENGAIGLSMITTHHPDLIILDVMMPDMNGFEVIKRLRADQNTIPIILLTAKDLTAEEQSWLREQSLTHLQKATMSGPQFIDYLQTIIAAQGANHHGNE